MRAIPRHLPALCAAAALLGADAAAAPQARQEDVLAFARTWRGQCHAAPEPESDLDLLGLLQRPLAAADLPAVLAMRRQLETGDMPPDGEPRPPRADVEAVLAWADQVLAAAAPAAPAPGRVTIRRLSRAEYDRAVFDLLGVGTELSRLFPRDDLGYGFDNIGAAASFSTLHLEKYAAAAADLARQAVVLEDPANPPIRHFEAASMRCSLPRPPTRGELAVLVSDGDFSERTELPRDGDYLIRVRACGDQAGGEPVRMALRTGGRDLALIDVTATRHDPQSYEHRARLPAGETVVSVAFTNDYYRPDDPDPKNRDRNLLVDWVELVGPVDPPALPTGHRWLMAADPREGSLEERTRAVVAAMLLRVWRRPPAADEVARLTELALAADPDGERLEPGLRLALQAALVSPHFLFRVEPEAAAAADAHTQELDGFALATRLSFFLWSSTPDEQLLELARTGALRTPATLVAETRRLLDDPRASALSENFAAQWLELRALSEAEPDPDRFPGFDDELRADMRRETELLFESVLREKRSVFALLDADYTFLTGRLAAHYGVDGVAGPHFRRVRVLDPRRRGLLGHASIQTVTSHPTRTSPTKRGKWILDHLLDDPPPPPPPGNDAFREDEVGHLTTLREKLAAHRSKPECAACHARMDALGLTLEGFDPIGRARAADEGVAIDTTSELPGGRRIDGPEGLRALLGEGRAFVRCLLKKLFVYGVGRDAAAADEIVLDALLRTLPPEPTLEDLVVAIVRLDAFRCREPAN